MGVTMKKFLMTKIAKNMNEVLHEFDDTFVSGEGILEVYKMEINFLAQELDLLDNQIKIVQYLDILQEILGEEKCISLERDQLIDLIKVIQYLS